MTKNNFKQRDIITGRELRNPLNKKKLTQEEMEELLLEEEDG